MLNQVFVGGGRATPAMRDARQDIGSYKLKKNRSIHWYDVEVTQLL